LIRALKLTLIAAGALAGIAVLLAIVAALVLRVNTRPRVEAMASQALGMEVHVGGRLSISLLPGLHIAMADVHVGPHDAEVATAQAADLTIGLLPLLRRQFQPERIDLKDVTIAIVRDHTGRLNVEASSGSNGTLPALSVSRLSVSDAKLAYSNEQSGNKIEAEGCNLEVHRLQLLRKNLSIAATLACRQVRTKDSAASDLKLSVDGHDGVFHFDPVTLELFGGHGSGSVSADFSGSAPVYQAHYRLAQFRIEELLKRLSPRTIAQGSMDFSANVSVRGKTMAELAQSLGGEASLRSTDLKLAINDLDEKLSRYESSQSFNLIDVGAIFLIGPLGLVVTKGYEFARIYQGPEGSSAIRLLVSEWQVEHGVAQAKDVAMATQKNRIALKGGLDFVNGQFQDVTLAVIDTNGCVKVQQKVHGPFLHPDVDKPSVIGAITGPTRKLFRQAKTVLAGKCEVFYAGSVAPLK
jgi:uncharacterized protein involved in outer membrane biogenesis